mgnify:CR=1 FL=1
MKSYIKCIALLVTFGVFTSFAAESADPTEAVENKSNNNSIRVRISSAPGIDTIEDSDGSFDIDEGGGSRVDVMYARRFSGLWGNSDSNFGGVIAGGVFFGSHSGSFLGLIGTDLITIETDLTTFGGILEGGLVYKADDSIVLEITPYFGFGGAQNETTLATDGSGPMIIYGINGSVFVLLSDNIELGLQAGYSGFSHDQDFADEFGVTETVTFSGSGATFGGVLVIKF